MENINLNNYNLENSQLTNNRGRNECYAVFLCCSRFPTVDATKPWQKQVIQSGDLRFLGYLLPSNSNTQEPHTVFNSSTGKHRTSSYSELHTFLAPVTPETCPASVSLLLRKRKGKLELPRNDHCSSDFTQPSEIQRDYQQVWLGAFRSALSCFRNKAEQPFQARKCLWGLFFFLIISLSISRLQMHAGGKCCEVNYSHSCIYQKNKNNKKKIRQIKQTKKNNQHPKFQWHVIFRISSPQNHVDDL